MQYASKSHLCCERACIGKKKSAANATRAAIHGQHQGREFPLCHVARHKSSMEIAVLVNKLNGGGMLPLEPQTEGIPTVCWRGKEHAAVSHFTAGNHSIACVYILVAGNSRPDCWHIYSFKGLWLIPFV